MNSQHELRLDEAFALLDGFDLGAAAYESSTHDTTSPSSSSCDTSTDSDAALLALLSDLEPSGSALPWDAASSVSSQPAHQDELPRSSSPAAQLQRPQLNKKKPSSNATAATELVKRPRKESKSEILKLRQELEALQAQHASLQMAHGQKRQRLAVQHSSTTALVTSSAASPHFMWLEITVAQHKALKESQSLNRRLRSAVAQQRKVTDSMQALFQKTVPHKELDLLLKAPATNVHLQLPSPRDQLLALLYRNAENQYRETDRMCHRISRLNDTRAAFTICDTKLDAKNGLTYEMTASVPVANDFRVIGRLLWSRGVENRGPLAMHSLHPLEPTTQNQVAHVVHEKRVEMTVPSSRYGALRVDGVAIVCKFEEERRIVLSVVAAYTVGDTSISIRESGLIVVSKARSDARPASAATSLFQSYHRIHRENAHESRSPLAGALSLPDEKTRHVQEIVLKALDDHMRQHMAELQQSLLSEAESLALNLMEFKCPMAECTC